MVINNEEVFTAGLAPDKAKKALIMIHGRGATARGMLELWKEINDPDFFVLAPQAPGNTWYPHSFMAPVNDNEPRYGESLGMLKATHNWLIDQGFTNEQVYWLGFSQGACLVTEYTTRNACKYGGVIAFTGGLIGNRIYGEHYSGQFNGTPVFLGTSDPDPHVPVERVDETEKIMSEMGAKVQKKVYPGMPHTINQEEISFAKTLLVTNLK